MSFERSAALESQPTTLRRQDDAQYSDDPEYTTFTTELSDKLFSLTSNISQLNRQVGLIGTKRETDRVRERMQDLVDETNTAFKDIGEGLKRLSTWPDLNASQLYTRNKLNDEFKHSLPEFQLIQNRILEKQRASANAARSALEESQDASQTGGGGGSGTQQQQQLQQQEQLRLAPQSEVDFQESLIIERESEIRQIEQSVGELNELFRDVGMMVREQGEQLDIISVNVDSTRTDTQGAALELGQAARHQRSARSKACCLLLVLAIVLVVVILAVVLG